ncbi:MAG: GAF domain-containing protein [Nitrospirae bacterium]|nr:GAF domain-containing protein [Nitrospirota bacterium]
MKKKAVKKRKAITKKVVKKKKLVRHNNPGNIKKNHAEYENKVRQLSTLMALSTILNSTLEQKEVRRRAIEAATRLTESEVGSLLLVDAEKNELFFEVALGEKGEKVKEIRLKIGEGIAGWVAKTGEAVIIDDVQQDPRFFKGADKKSSFVTRNMICVPVKSEGKSIGVLQAINKLKGGRFTKDDLEGFKSLADQVAVAIEKSRLYQELRDTFFCVAEALADAIEKRDPYTGGHTKRVLQYSLAIGKHIGLMDNEIERLKLAAVLHDIGKIGIEDSILRKRDKLNNDEYEMIKKHPVWGSEIMGHIKQLKDVIPGMRYHHERIDGKGYPDHLCGNEIPLIAKIISVADTVDAITTERPYQESLSMDVAFKELRDSVGTQFDGKVVEAFLMAYEAGDININNAKVSIS